MCLNFKSNKMDLINIITQLQLSKSKTELMNQMLMQPYFHQLWGSHRVQLVQEEQENAKHLLSTGGNLVLVEDTAPPQPPPTRQISIY